MRKYRHQVYQKEIFEPGTAHDVLICPRCGSKDVIRDDLGDEWYYECNRCGYGKAEKKITGTLSHKVANF